MRAGPQTPYERQSFERTMKDVFDRMLVLERRIQRVRRSLNLIVDGRGSPITAGIKGDVRLDYRCLLLGWKLVADQVGEIELDVWKDSFDNFPPTIADSICGSHPELVGQIKNSDETLTGWTTLFEAGDYLRLNVVSVDGSLTRVVLTLELMTGVLSAF